MALINETTLDRSDIKIVVVDDSDFSRNNIVNVLKKEGFNVVCSSNNAKEGLANGKKTNANLYIIDAIMPVRSGLEMANIITENFVKAKVIMISSLHNEQTIIESISSGATDFLPKPFDPMDLIRAVEKAEAEMEME